MLPSAWSTSGANGVWTAATCLTGPDASHRLAPVLEDPPRRLLRILARWTQHDWENDPLLPAPEAFGAVQLHGPSPDFDPVAPGESDPGRRRRVQEKVWAPASERCRGEPRDVLFFRASREMKET